VVLVGESAEDLLPAVPVLCEVDRFGWPSVGLSRGELARTVLDQELDSGHALSEVHQEVAGCLCRPGAVGVRGDAGQADAAGAVLDEDQRVHALQEHGVHVSEIDRKNAAGLRGKELFPRRAGAAGRGADSGGVQDLPDRGGGDRVAELDQFALDPPVPAGTNVTDAAAGHEFYTEFLGLEKAFDLGWIAIFRSPANQAAR
jgi:hypothetical protein